MFEILKEILNVRDAPGVIIVGVLFIIALVLKSAKTSVINEPNTAFLFNKIIGIAIAIVVVGLATWAIINLFNTLDKSKILEHKHKMEARGADSLEIEKKINEIKAEEKRLEQLRESIDSKKKSVDSLISIYKNGIEMNGADEKTFHSSRKAGYYSSEIEIREGRRYNDLRTGVSFFVKSIDIKNRVVDFIIDGLDHYLANEQLIFQDAGKRILFIEDGEKFEFTFSNFRKIDGERTSNLNVNKID